MRGKAVLIVCILCFSLMFSLNVYLDDKVAESNGPDLEPESVSVPSSYTPHGRINIENDTALQSIATSGTGGFGDPLIIEGWNITVDDGFAIIIRDTTLYFRIQNCWIDAGEIGVGVGIWVFTVPIGTAGIRDVHVQDCFQGIQLGSAPGTTISTCSIINCETGIYGSNSNDAIVFNSTISDCAHRGVELSGCDDAVVMQNNFSRMNEDGSAGSAAHQGTAIRITSGSSSSIVYNNTCTEGWYEGISVAGSSGSISENKVSNFRIAGIELVTGSGIVCTDNDVYDNDDKGIYILSSDATVANNTLSRNGMGIAAYQLSNLILENNTLYDDGFYFPFGAVLDYAGVQEDNNLVNGRPLGYLVSEIDTTYSTSFGQVVLIDCDGVRLENQNCSYTYDGVFMRYSDNCRIRNSQFLNNHRDGIWIEDSMNNEIEHTIISYNGRHGMGITNSNPLTITNVTSSYNTENGFDIYDCYSLTITGCTVNGNMQGVVSHTDGSATISGNSFADNLGAGLSWIDTWSAQVISNAFTNDGIYFVALTVEGYIGFTGNHSGNMVNGKPLGYYSSLTNAVISTEHGQVYLVNCTDVILTNQDCSNTLNGILVLYSDNCSILDSVCSNNKREAIKVDESLSIQIQRTTCDNSLLEGMRIMDSPHTFVDSCYCRGNAYGINVDNSIYVKIEGTIITGNSGYGLDISSCDNANVVDNVINSNMAGGVHLTHSDYSIVDSNEIGYNPDFGLSYGNSIQCFVTDNHIHNNDNYGISIVACDSIIITGNFVSRTDGIGLSLDGAISTTVTFNIISENTYFGIYSWGSVDLLVHHCVFVENRDEGSQAFDFAPVNSQWYDGQLGEGNYWSDWDGVGPYMIDGGQLDIYPLGFTDADSDSLSDEFEILNGLNPYSSDSDSDSIPDFYEVMNGLDPLTDDSGLDEDSDGLTNLQEYLLGTSANNSDSDGDLMPDLWEIENYLYPLFDDAGFDPDGDGSTNLEEYLAGTNPHFNEGATGPSTTTGPTTSNPPPSGSIIPLILAAVGGFVVAVFLIFLIQRKPTTKAKS